MNGPAPPLRVEGLCKDFGLRRTVTERITRAEAEPALAHAVKCDDFLLVGKRLSLQLGEVAELLVGVRALDAEFLVQDRRQLGRNRRSAAMRNRKTAISETRW